MPSPELQSAACCWQSQPNACHPDPPPPDRLSSSLSTHALRADRAPSMQCMRAQGEPAQTPRPLQPLQTGPTPPGASYMGPLRAGSVAAASVDDQPSEHRLAFAGEPRGSSSDMAMASGPLRWRCGPGCPAMGARSLQAARCSARPRSQPQGMQCHAAVRRGSPRLLRRADPLPSQNSRFSLLGRDCLFGGIRRVGWPELALKATSSGGPFPPWRQRCCGVPANSPRSSAAGRVGKPWAFIGASSG
jgi:hypothetical protein